MTDSNESYGTSWISDNFANLLPGLPYPDLHFVNNKGDVKSLIV